jgi:maltose/moltooligosaccharide transporter
MKKKKLSFWEIWNMSFGFLGIQMGFAIQNANTSRIFETLGAKIEEIPILWIAAPLTGLIVQPIIGYFSDRTWTVLGRRRPYFLVGAILSTIALFFMPNSPALWAAAIMLWVMDSSFNITMEPFRAFVADNLPKEQRNKGFAMQSFFIGIGAVVGSLLPWILTNWFHLSNVAPEGMIPESLKWSYYIVAVIMLLAVLWTVFKSKEYTPEELASFHDAKTVEDYIKDEDTSEKKQMNIGIVMIVLGLLSTLFLTQNKLEKELYVLTVGIGVVGLLFALSSYLKGKKNTGSLVNITSDLLNMPSTMKQLAWVQFFSWFALFAMWIYTTKIVTGYIYNATDVQSELYNEGADWVNVLFAVYNGVAALVAFLLPLLAKKISRKVTHAIALTLGGLGLLSIFFISDPNMLIISMIGVGIAWASILSMPYAMLSSVLPPKKMGYFMGVFNFFIVIPQLIAATILGFMVKEIFDSQPIYALIVGGFSMILAGLLTLRVNDNEE